MRSSTMTPAPPGSDCESCAGNGFQMSKRRKRKNAHTSTGTVRGPDADEHHAHESEEETEAREGNEPEGNGRHRAAGGSRRDGRVAGAPAAGDREREAVRRADRLFPHELVAVHLHDSHLGEAPRGEAPIPQIDDPVD